MPWLETNVHEQRLQFVMAARRPEADVSAVCRQFGVSRTTGYRWLRRYHEARSLLGVTARSRRPRHSPRQTPDALVARVVALRQTYGWAGRKLQVLLREEGVTLSTATIDRIIRRARLVDVTEASRPALTRFERDAPNALWQMDFKGQYPLGDGTACFPLSVLDDHSRFAVGLIALTGTAGGPVLAALRSCFDRYGLPEAILVDHGAPWWSTANGHGLTAFAVALLAQGIQLIYSGVRHPQTQGKVERFHRTLARRLRQWGVPQDLATFGPTLARFRVEYNEVRPHEATQLRPPAQCYTPSPRRYQTDPRPWTYPAGWVLGRVDHAGCLSQAGRRYFVCAALAGQWVATHRLDHVLVVQYRNYYIREVDLTTGRSVPLLTRVHAAVSPMS